MSGARNNSAMSLESRASKYFVRSGAYDCWLWTGYKNERGYGVIYSGAPQRRVLKAHRVVYELEKGKIPNGLILCHHCDTPACVNPNHMFVGTHRENVLDMLRKGRRKTEYAVGERQGCAKLTSDSIPVILSDPRPASALAEQYGVNASTIRRVRQGIQWRHISRRHPRDAEGRFAGRKNE